MLAGGKDHVSEPAALAGSMSVPSAPPPPPSDMQALLPAAAAWAVGGLAAGVGAGAASGMGVKEVPTMGVKEVPTGLIGAALGGVKKDKAPRLVKKGRKGGGQPEEQAAEQLLGGEDVDPLYALSVHAVSASAKEKAAKDALKTGEGSAAGKDKDRSRDGVPGKDKSPSAISLDDKVPSRSRPLASSFLCLHLVCLPPACLASTCQYAVCAHCCVRQSLVSHACALHCLQQRVDMLGQAARLAASACALVRRLAARRPGV